MTYTHPVKLFTSSSVMPPTEGRKISSKEIKATPFLDTTATTTVNILESFTAEFPKENAMTSSHSSVPDKKSVPTTAAQLRTHTTPGIKYVDYKLKQPPTHPGETLTGSTARHTRRDQDWQVSVYVVTALLLGFVAFVAIMLVKSIRRTRLVC